jgi:hypothetical protein
MKSQTGGAAANNPADREDVRFLSPTMTVTIPPRLAGAIRWSAYQHDRTILEHLFVKLAECFEDEASCHGAPAHRFKWLVKDTPAEGVREREGRANP